MDGPEAGAPSGNADPLSQHDLVLQLGAQLRELKASLRGRGMAAAEVNKHPEVLAKLDELQAAKSQLDAGDAATDEAFFSRQREGREKAKAELRAAASAEAAELKAQEQLAPRPVVQRKIFHLFQYSGSGDSFQYEPPPRLNSAQCGWAPASSTPVYITEKWDGTTMQASSTHIFKRLDLWGARRKGADPSQRYDLRLVAWRGADTDWDWRGLEFQEADLRVFQALSGYLPALAGLAAGLCVYFEVVHERINSTFQHLPGFADIRVFDFSRDAAFLPFEDTISLSERHGLPLVGWHLCDHLDAQQVWDELVMASNGGEYGTAQAPLEGFVIREAGKGDRIAKARVAHLPGGAESAAADRGPAHRMAHAPSHADRLSLAQLVEIGICTPAAMGR